MRLSQIGARSIAQAAADLDLTETGLREWVKWAKEAPVASTTEALRDAEREALYELRKRVKRLAKEREILKNATTFFAKESG